MSSVVYGGLLYGAILYVIVRWVRRACRPHRPPSAAAVSPLRSPPTGAPQRRFYEPGDYYLDSLFQGSDGHCYCFAEAVIEVHERHYVVVVLAQLDEDRRHAVAIGRVGCDSSIELAYTQDGEDG